MNINEDWVDQRNSSWNAPYTFSGKEKDAETGYGYFGSRYYDSDLGIWLSVDKMSDKYTSISPYNYCTNNPVILNDPDGNDPIFSIYGKITVGTNGYNIGCQLYYSNGNDTWSRSYGAGLTYYSNFYNTGKSGFEFRESLMFNYNSKNFSASIGTNLWQGTGEMREFNQRTGILKLGFMENKIRLSYENDGVPFGDFFFGDGGDSYRTAAFNLGIFDFDLNINLFTGYRDFENEGELIGTPSVGQFGENYKFGLVNELGPKYRYGGLTISYQGLELGLNSEWIRNYCQNIFAHGVIKKQRGFLMTNNLWFPVLNYSTNQNNNFTLWDN